MKVQGDADETSTEGPKPAQSLVDDYTQLSETGNKYPGLTLRFRIGGSALGRRLTANARLFENLYNVLGQKGNYCLDRNFEIDI